MKVRISDGLRKRVFERDNYTCRYCGTKDGPFHADHVYPESRGGETSLGNLVTACQRCNSRKRDRLGVYPMSTEQTNAAAVLVEQEKNARVCAERRLSELSESKKRKDQQVLDLSHKIKRPAPMIWFWLIMLGSASFFPIVLSYFMSIKIDAGIGQALLVFGTIATFIGLTISFTWEAKR